MSEQTQNSKDSDDGVADGIAATAVISLVVLAVVFWLAGMPT